MVDRKIEVLYVITRATRGGAQVHVLSLARQAQLAGWTVLVATGETGWLTTELATSGVEFVVVSGLARSWRPDKLCRYLLTLRRLVRGRNFEVVHFHSSNALLGLCALVGIRPRPLAVATVHGWSALHPGWRKSWIAQRLFGLVMRLALPLADRVVYVCRSDAAFAVRMGLGDAKRAAVIHNGIAADLQFATRPDAQKALCITDAAWPIVGTVCRLDYAKDVGLLVSAAASPELSSADFVVVGDGPESHSLALRAASLGLASHFRFVGARPALSTLKGFDVFVLTSRYEGFPYSLLEAAMAGVPIVAADVGGVGELVQHGVTGRLFPSGDLAALIRELRWVLAHKREAQALARRAQQLVVSDFNESDMLSQLVQVYGAKLPK